MKKLLTLLFRLFVVLVLSSKTKGADVCRTEECIRAAHQIKRSMDTKVKPCHDFYNFACGGWRTSNPIPEGLDSWSVGQILQEKVWEEMRERIKDPAPNDSHIQSSKDLYRLCMHMPSFTSQPVDEIKKIIKEVGTPTIFGGSESRNWAKAHEDYLSFTGESPLFDIQLSGYKVVGYRPVIDFILLYSPYGSTRYYNGIGDTTEYVKYVKALVQKIAFGKKKLPKSVVEDIEEVVRFRKELDDIITSCNKEEDYRNLMGVGKLIENFGPPKSEIDWLKIVRLLLKSAAIGEDTVVNVRIKKYFEDLMNVLKKSPKTILNHIHLYFAERYTQHDKELSGLLRNAILSGSKRKGDIRTLEERWKYCFVKNNLSNGLGKLYVRRNFPRERKQQMRPYINDVKTTVKNQLANSWLSSEAKDLVNLKIDTLTETIGYPDWYDGGREREITEPSDPIDVNAYYNIDLNEVFLNAAFFQPPNYYPSMPYVIDYGATVTTFGHEIHHAFDKPVFYNDFNCTTETTKKPETWQGKACKEFDQRLQCFIDQYNQYTVPELGSLNIKVNGEKTLSENVADVMGLKVTYEIFQDRIKKEKGKCPVLVGLENYTCDQLFFIAFGTTFCANVRPEILERVLESHDHTTQSVRVNAVVSNVRAFGEAFNCKKPLSPLRPRTECDLWK